MFLYATALTELDSLSPFGVRVLGGTSAATLASLLVVQLKLGILSVYIPAPGQALPLQLVMVGVAFLGLRRTDISFQALWTEARFVGSGASLSVSPSTVASGGGKHVVVRQP